MKMSRQSAGFSLVEVMLAATLLVLIVSGLVGGTIYGQESTALSGSRGRARLLAEEGLEAARNIRDSNFTNLSDGTYGLAISGGQWTLSGSSDATDIFTRQVVISTVNSNTKSVTSTVTWTQTGQRSGSVSLSGRLYNWLVTADWINPTTGSTLDLSGTQDGIKVQVSGNYAYVVRNNTTANFVVVDISNPASPSVAATLNLGGTPSNIFVSGNYAYVSSSNDSQEMQIVSISNPVSPSLTGSYNADGGENANGIYVVGTTAYLTRDACSGGLFGCSADWFITLNVSNPAAPSKLDALHSGSGLLGLGGDENLLEVVVLGNYAHVGTDDSGGELLIINVTNPSSISATAGFNASGSTSGVSVSGFGNTVLLGGANGTLYILNVTTPGSPSLISSYSAGGSVNDISLGYSNNYAFLATANGSREFAVVNIYNTASPTLLGGRDLSATLNGIAYSSSLNRAIGVSGADASEVFILAPR